MNKEHHQHHQPQPQQFISIEHMMRIILPNAAIVRKISNSGSSRVIASSDMNINNNVNVNLNGNVNVNNTNYIGTPIIMISGEPYH